jgi:PAS domain S-box-containing protein
MLNLFTAGGYIPHGHCYLWQTGLVELHVLSDSLIAIAYYSIPLTLLYFVRKRQDLPFNRIFILFGAFIVACGTTHIMDVWTLWYPTYWLSGSIKAVTALVSVYTAMTLVPLVPQALALPSPAQLEAANRELEREIQERQQIEAELRVSEARYRAILEDQTELIARFTPDGTVTFVNGAFCRYFQQQREELIGSRYEPVIFPTDRQMVVQLIDSLSRENPLATIENRVVVAGEVRWTQWINRALFDSQDRLVEIQSVGRDISDRKLAEQQQASLQEKEALLKEIHHRVKNNLQIVYSLLRLQQRRTLDRQAADILLVSQNRIQSIALVHEKLYRSDNLAEIDFAQYISSLAASLLSSYRTSSEHIALETKVEPISLDIDRAIPCGLILNELVSNALKYAFPENCAGQIQVELRATSEDLVQLTVSDNGIGIPAQFDLSQTKSLGLQLVQDFVNQLEGSVRIERQQGTIVEISFPCSVNQAA